MNRIAQSEQVQTNLRKQSENVHVYLFTCIANYPSRRGRVVTLWSGSQKVWGSIMAATKIVRFKKLAFNIGECVSCCSDTT